MNTILSWLDLYDTEKVNTANIILFISCGNLLWRNDLVSALGFLIAMAFVVCKWVFAPKPKSKVDLSEIDTIREQVKHVHEQLTQTRMAIGFKAAR